MKKVTRYILMALLCMLAACVNEDFPKGEEYETLPEGTPVNYTIHFGVPEMPRVDVSTKSELTEIDENRIYNLYVIIFNEDGDKIYGRLFDPKDLVADETALDNSENECWYNDLTSSGSSGAVKVATVAKPNCQIYVTSNIGLSDATVNGSSSLDKYNNLTNIEELRALVFHLSEETVDRRGYLPMAGIQDETVGGSSINTGTMTHKLMPESGKQRVLVTLRRFDAKIRFRVRANTTNISKLEPLLWNVMNVPTSSYILERPTNSGTVVDADTYDSEGTFFDTQEAFFEGKETETIDAETVEWNVFTFYMLENRLKPRQVISGDTHTQTDSEGHTKTYSNYYLREKQDKSASDVQGYVQNGDWTYANPNSTAIAFSVNLQLTDNGLAELTGVPVAEVTQVGLTTRGNFTVHLGDFTSCDYDGTHNFNDYSTFRNHLYTYDIVVNNVNSIYVEVKDHNLEPQASAEGGIVVADQSIINCDAHYENHLMAFNYLDPDDIGERFTWYVKTPFSTGSPTRLMQASNPSQPLLDSDGNIQFSGSDELDYKWVSFMLNKESGGEYVDTRQPYPGDGNSQLMDVNELINFLYQEAKKWKDTSTRSQSIFYNGTQNEQRVVKFTAFVNEFYYERHPITGELDPLLWKQFVGAPARELHILSNTEYSLDRKSTVVTSSHSIVQRSIQTIYNTDSPALRSLYGTEFEDEYETQYSRIEDWEFKGAAALPWCNDNDRGRLNTSRMWGLTNEQGTTWNTLQWGDMLNFEVGENVPQLQSEYRKQVYGCLLRNRDNNGDGVIDKDEVRWYLAALNQLNGLWIGDESLALDARLYHQQDAELHHVLSSTSGDGGCYVMWAEEGNSVSTLSQSQSIGMSRRSYTDMWKHYSIRCLRNVGTYDDENDGTTKDVTYGPVNQNVDNYVTITTRGTGDDTVMEFNLENLNPKSKRFYTSGELIAAEQTSVVNRVYQKFETLPKSANIYQDNVLTGQHVEVMNQDITDTGIDSWCPAGYRLPNQREASLIALNKTYYPGIIGNQQRTFTRTFWNYGWYGTKKTGTDGIGYANGKWQGYFIMSMERTNLTALNDNQDINIIRCVKDVNATADLNVKLLASSGKMFAESVSIVPGQTATVHRSIYSPYSDIASVEIYLCYYKKNGQYVESKFFEELHPGKKVEDETISSYMPGVEYWDDVDLTKAVKFKMTASNEAGTVKSDEVPIQVKKINVEPVENEENWL